MAHWHNEPITVRQSAAIRLIHQFLGVQFHGYNKGQASAFIGEHYELAKIGRDRHGRVDVQTMTNRQVARQILEEVTQWD